MARCLYYGHIWPHKGELLVRLTIGNMLAVWEAFGHQVLLCLPNERLPYNIMFYYIPKLDLNAKQTATVVSTFHTLYMYAAMQHTNGNTCHKSV